MRSFAPELSELRFREVGAKTKHAALEYIDLLDRLPSLVERALARQAVTP